MDFNIEVRKKQLENLEQLVSTSKNRIQSVLSYLGWAEDNIQKGDLLVQCPVNSHHRICPKSWNEHIKKCLVRIEGYDLKSQFLSESLEDPRQSIYLDHNKKIEIITKELSERGPLRLAWNGLDPDPRTADRWITTYSPDERLAFYNYCVQNTVGPPEPAEFNTLFDKKQDEEKLLSYEELLVQQRDAKRRRAKYKSVHINRKNHTEVIREVINGQMEDYKEWLSVKKSKVRKNSEERSINNGIEEEKKEEERPHSSISRTSNHSSSSRSTNRKYKDNRDPSKEYRNNRESSREYRDTRESSKEYREKRESSYRPRRSRSSDRKYKHEDRRHNYRDRRRSRSRDVRSSKERGRRSRDDVKRR